MKEVMRRLSSLRQVGLAVVGADKELPDFPPVFNAVTSYQTNPDAMVGKLLCVVVEQAEMHASLLTSAAAPVFAEQAVLQRMYGVSVGLMCEVYKSAAYRDVLRLREMPELDRSVVIAQYERLGGMKYDHVLDGYCVAMDRMLDTANLILESRQRS